MNTRIAQSSDLETLVYMGEQLHLVEKQYEPLLTFSREEARQRYLAELDNSSSLLLLAEENNKPVGYLYAHADKIEYFSTDKLECEIEVIFITPEFRGKKIAQLLINKCIDWTKTKDVFRIKTGIYAQNTASQSVFAKLGFTPYHTTYTLQRG